MDRDRFDALVDRSAEHHIWTGAVNPQRRTGRLKVAGRQVTAHRHAWELAHGPLPASAKVLACPEQPACVRVDHLRVEGMPESFRPATRARKGTGSIRQVRPGVWKLAATTPAGIEGRSKRVHRVVHVRTSREAADELASFVAEVRSAGRPSVEAVSLHLDEAVERFLTEFCGTRRGARRRRSLATERCTASGSLLTSVIGSCATSTKQPWIACSGGCECPLEWWDLRAA